MTSPPLQGRFEFSGSVEDTEAAGDVGARRQIATDLASTLFVEAGAGTGKTQALVGRVLELVVTGAARLEQIAAITFTEAAAAELRDRVGEQLERLATEADDNEEVGEDPLQRARRAERCGQALAELDGAAIGTLHSFARRILTAHPFEAGLPPSFEVYDELRSAVAFDERWGSFLDHLLADERYEEAILRLHVLGGTFEQLRTVAVACNENWDLVADLESADDAPIAVGEIDVGPVLAALERAGALAGHCTDPSDRLAVHLTAGLAEARTRLGGSRSALELLEFLNTGPSFSPRLGRKANWSGRLDDVKEALAQAQSVRRQLVAQVGAEALSQLFRAIGRHTLGAAATRRREGRLEFHDLLVGARDLLRSRPDVCAELGANYRYLLIDEFQDTDPIQAELAVRIVSGPPAPGRSTDWRQLRFDAGRLFFVGDPKQSIYRFRRADISLFMQMRDLWAGHPLQLTANYRSVPGVIDWVNELFTRTMAEGTEGMQPAYENLVAVRPRPPRDARPPAVTVVGGSSEADEPIDAVREREAAELAAVISGIRDQGWPVGADGRRARLADITVLVPSRTGLSILEAALESAAIPFRLESSSLVYSSAEVRDLLAVLRAVDDPADEISVVAALRSALFGCGDDDLLSYRRAGGHWNYVNALPVDLDPEHPVIRSLTSLGDLHRARWWCDVSELIERIIVERRVLALALDELRHRDAWRRVRFVADQARQFVEAFGGDLRSYLAWADLQGAEEARVTEIVLPETDDDSVRIMTVHAAKGLEFAVVVLSGLSTIQHNRGGPRVLFGAGPPEVALTAGIRTPGFDSAAEIEGDMDRHERLRLLYVAATRAQDYLVVGLHHKADTDCLAALIEGAGVADEPWASPAEPLPTPTVHIERRRSAPSEDPAEREAWIEDRRSRLEAAVLPRVLAATAVAKLAAAAGSEDLADEAGDEDPGPDRPPWRRGRAGTAVGRAVHAVLQSVDLARPAGVSELARVQAAAEGIEERAGEVEGLVLTALSSELVTTAAQARHWRELYVGVPVGERVLEGFVDLVYESPDGLVVVDYKTDQVSTPEELDRSFLRYRLQAVAYAVAVERALGRPVARCTLLFLKSGQATALDVGALDQAKRQVVDLLSH